MFAAIGQTFSTQKNVRSSEPANHSRVLFGATIENLWSFHAAAGANRNAEGAACNCCRQ